MNDFPDFYPASPRFVPEDLTEPSPSFRRHINLVSFSLLLFFFVYFGLMSFMVLGIVLCLRIHLCLGAAAAAVCLVPMGILIKNLFNTQKMSKGFEVEIDLDEQPRLREFLECICAETGAPMPHRVLLNHEVNAAAGGAVSLANLVVEPSRDLILGLGLINILNMTEFKALLAHEFGHLSQFKMKSGPFVRIAMQVVFNILHGTRLVYLDKVMEYLFIFVVKLNQALSREMEFHADRVAISITGSDAIIHLLYKCYWAEACLQRTVSDLAAAKDHDLYSRDVFQHQLRAGHYLRERAKDSALGEPPPLRLDSETHTYQLFEPERDRDKVAEMWADHPSNHEREINAKIHYIRGEMDETTAWSLFSNPQELRRLVSLQFYKQVFNVKEKEVDWSSAKKVQEFLDDEYAETNFDEERYGILYNYRCLEAMSLRELRDHAEVAPNAPARLLASHSSMYTPNVKKFAKVFQRHLNEYRMLEAILNRWYRPAKKKFEMRGKKFHVKKAEGMLKQLTKEIEADAAWLRRFDIHVFVTYFELAWQFDKKRAEELYQRYRFHYVMQGMWRVLQVHKSPMAYMFELLENVQGGILDEDTFHVLIEVFRRAYDALQQVIEEAKLVKFPELSNMPAGKSVRPFLLDDRLTDRPSHFDTSIKQKWLMKFAKQFHDVERRLDRLHYKSLGNILSLQESIGADAEKKWTDPIPHPAEEPAGS
jgi:Zn-dependent protease with chaperone function